MDTIIALVVWAIVIVIVIGVVWVINYNRLQSLANLVKEASSNIKVMMKKRVDLTNRLIDIAAGYGSHEKLVHIKVSQDMATGMSSLAQSYHKSNQALTYVSRLADNFPELKADRTYLRLMDELKIIEGDLQSKREFYNGYVRNYNTKRSSIPAAFFSGAMGFTAAPFLDFDAADDLDTVKDFQTDDGTMLQNVLSNFGGRIVDASKNFGGQVSKAGSDLLEKGKEHIPQVKFYYADAANQPAGPKTLSELDELLASGHLSEDSYVVEEGGKEWKPFRSVCRKSSSSPPPPPPPRSQS